VIGRRVVGGWRDWRMVGRVEGGGREGGGGGGEGGREEGDRGREKGGRREAGG
jgi:hypothetical protein